VVAHFVAVRQASAVLILQNNKDTITREQFMEWTKSVWTMNAESARRVGHPVPFPVELPYRLIQLYSFTGDIILDPFMGSGTTAIAALTSERNYVGYDTNPDYIELVNKRIEVTTEKVVPPLFTKTDKPKTKGYTETLERLKTMADTKGKG
jgi:DNA modification methylase